MQHTYTRILILICSFLITFTASATLFNVTQFGAKGNGIADDTYAVQAAINAAAIENNGSTIYFPAGIYRFATIYRSVTYLENYFLLLKPNIKLIGDGQRSILKIADGMFNKTDEHANAHLFKGTNISDVAVSNLLIDLNGGHNLVPANSNKNAMAFLMFKGENVSFDNITIQNCAGQNMIAMRDGGNGVNITNCRFYNGGHYVGTDTENKYQVDFSFLYSEWKNTVITGNIIEQKNIRMALTSYTGGIEIHHSDATVTNNIITGCFPGMYIASTFGVLENVLIENNKFNQCVKGISFWCADSIKKVTISSNSFTVINATTLNVTCTGIEVPNGNTLSVSKENANAAPIDGLQIISNTIQSLLPADTKDKSIAITMHSLHNANIEKNTISNFNLSAICFSGSKWGVINCIVSNNIIRDNQPNIDDQAAASNIMITDTYSSEVKEAPGFTKLSFINNVVTGKAAANNKNLLGIFVAVPEKAGRGITFSNNSFTGTFKEKEVIIKTPTNYK